MINSDQIRAARALLRWGQDDLAKYSDVSIGAIRNLEVDKQQPTANTLGKIQNAFEDAGIEFIEGGVRKVNNFVRVIEGEDCYLKVLDEALLVLAPQKGEFLSSAADERRSSPIVIEKFRLMRKQGIQMRSLIRNTDTYIMGKLHEYRWMNEGLFAGGDVKAIYDDTVVYLAPKQNVPKAVVIKDAQIADEARRIFNFVWSISPVPTSTSSDIRYEEQ